MDIIDLLIPQMLSLLLIAGQGQAAPVKAEGRTLGLLGGGFGGSVGLSAGIGVGGGLYSGFGGGGYGGGGFFGK